MKGHQAHSEGDKNAYVLGPADACTAECLKSRRTAGPVCLAAGCFIIGVAAGEDTGDRDVWSQKECGGFCDAGPDHAIHVHAQLWSE